MNIALVGYRAWALEIYNNLIDNFDSNYHLVKSKDEFCESKLRDFNPDFILFYGWSWIIPESIINDFKCIMLHPSPLPKYRGGSPIQNQLINGEQKSAVTIFLMDEGIDTGPIIKQKSIMLEGSLNNIFSRITKIGTELTLDFLKNGYDLEDQDHSKATYFKRRKKEDSEITIDELNTKDADYLYNKIRMLQDPYPNPYIRTADGKKLILLKAKIEE